MNYVKGEKFKYDGKNLRQGDLVFNLATAGLKLNEYQKKIDELEQKLQSAEEKLRGEQQSGADLARFLNEEKLRHGETEKKLQAAEERERILREAVEFYANKDLYQTSTSNYRNHKRVLPAADIECERGTKEQGFAGLKARQALEKVRGGK